MQHLHATPRRRRAFTRFLIAGAVFSAVGFLLLGAHHSDVPTFSVGMTSAAYGSGAPPRPIESPDLPILLDLWGVGGGPSLPLQLIEAPEGIHAGSPLAVDVTCVDPMHQTLTMATVEVDWLIGDQRYHDVSYTDDHGRASFVRVVDSQAKGQHCIVSVRVHKDDLQSFAYAWFVPE